MRGHYATRTSATQTIFQNVLFCYAIVAIASKNNVDVRNINATLTRIASTSAI